MKKINKVLVMILIMAVCIVPSYTVFASDGSIDFPVDYDTPTDESSSSNETSDSSSDTVDLTEDGNYDASATEEDTDDEEIILDTQEEDELNVVTTSEEDDEEIPQTGAREVSLVVSALFVSAVLLLLLSGRVLKQSKIN